MGARGRRFESYYRDQRVDNPTGDGIGLENRRGLTAPWEFDSPSTRQVFVDVAEWLRNGLQVRFMQVRILSSTPNDADIAQSEEQETFNLKVAGSIPAVRTT